jgi:hypothetical protein
MAKQKDYRFQKLNGIEQHLQSEIQYIWRDAIKYHHDWDQVHDSIKLRIYDHYYYSKLPMYIRHGLRKYEKALADYVWATQLQWVHWYDGKFVGKNLPYGPGFDQNKIDKSAHVWFGTETIYFHSESKSYAKQDSSNV